MKKTALALIVLFLCTGFHAVSDPALIHTYRDIPGITDDETAAVDEIIKEQNAFTLGYVPSAEAYIAADGRVSGFTAELAGLLSGLLDTPVELIPYPNHETLSDAFYRGEVHFLLEASPAHGYGAGDMASDWVAARALCVYACAPQIDTLHEVYDLNGLTAGFVGGDAGGYTHAAIQAVYPLLSVTRVDFATAANAAAALEAGQIDVVIADGSLSPAFAGDIFYAKELFTLTYVPLSLRTADAHWMPILTVLNRYIDAVGIDTFFDLYDTAMDGYHRHELFQSLTETERDWLTRTLADGGIIPVGLQHDAYPASFYNKSEKEFQGVALDILAEITKLTGLNFVQTATTEDNAISEIMTRMRAGEISMMMQLYYTEQRKDDFIWSNVPYLTTRYALLSRDNYPDVQVYQVPYIRVGTVYKTAHEEVFNTWFPQHENHIAYMTSDDGFLALEKGQIDLLMLSESMLLAQTNYREKTGYKINKSFNETVDSIFGYNKYETELRSVVDKAMAYVDTEAIATRWMNAVFDYSLKISRMQMVYALLCGGAALVFCAVMGYLFLLNRQLGKRLATRTATLQAIYTSIPDTLFCKDTEKLYINCNPAFEKQAGLREAEIIGQSFAQVFNGRAGASAEQDAETDDRVIGERIMCTTEETVTYPDGSRKLLETIKAPLMQDGKVVGLLGLGRDVTERREVENRFSRIINSAQIACILTLDDKIIEVNDYTQKNLGARMGDDIRRFYNDPGLCDTVMKITDLQGTAANIVARLNMANGSIHRFMTTLTSVTYEQRTAYLLWAIDIESDEQKKDQLRAAQQSFQAVLDTLPIPIVIIDAAEMTFAYVNDSLLELLDYDDGEEVYDLRIYDLLPDILADGTSSASRVDQIIRTGQPASFEIAFKTRHGRVIESLITTRQIDYRGKHCAIGIIKDLTAIKEQEQMLRNAADREKEANQLKGMFLANMSHEIRTPMNGVIGMTDLLLAERERLSPRQLNYVKDIKTSAESLLSIINDILDFSKINEGKLSVVPVDFDLCNLLKNITSMMGFSARNKHLALIDDIGVRSPEYVRADDVRLNQVIVNLMSNAIKFTQTGHVKLTARIDGDHIFFAVSDTGIGIMQSDLSSIFNPFEQADIRKNKAIKGTGLGLSISKNLVELMGGRIWVESEYGKGSAFIFTLPYVPGDGEAVEKRSLDTKFQYLNAPTAQVLVVDDIETNLTVCAGLLSLCGITADIALSGQDALELVRDKDYDLVLLDHMMPGMDGIETLQRIRAMGDKYRKLPVVALTANAMNESKDLLITAGMDDFLSKPINNEALMGILRQWLPEQKLIFTEERTDTEEAVAYSAVLDAASRIAGLDMALALSRISGLQEVLEASLRQVSHGADSQLAIMKTALEAQDIKRFAIQAHGLKGALAGIGAMGLSEMAAELEIAAKANNHSLCTLKFPVFAEEVVKFVGQLAPILAQADGSHSDKGPHKPDGDKTSLPAKVAEAIQYLEAYESADAIACLQSLIRFTYDEETDVHLADALAAAESFKYGNALRALKNIILPAKDTPSL